MNSLDAEPANEIFRPVVKVHFRLKRLRKV